MNTFRNDAEAMAFLELELQGLKAKTYDVKYADLMFRQLIPVDNQIPRGQTSIAYDQWDMVGISAWLDLVGDDLPSVDAFRKRFSAPMADFGHQYGYSKGELESARFAGIPLDAKRATASRRAADEFHERVALNGDSRVGLLGFLNQTNVNSYTVVAGAASDTEWETKTDEEILADLNGAANMGPVLCKDVESLKPDTMLLGLAKRNLIATRFLKGTSTVTILQHFLATNPYIKRVLSWARLDTAGTGGISKGVVYRLDPECLEYRTGIEYEEEAPQQNNFKFKIPVRANSGGVTVYQPLTMTYFEGH